MSYPPSGGTYDTIPTEASTAPAGSGSRTMKTPFRGLLRPRTQSSRTLLDEIIPTPSSEDSANQDSLYRVARRTGSVAVISIFLLSIIFLACTEGTLRGTGDNLRTIFDGSLQNTPLGGDAAFGSDPSQDVRPHPIKDFEKYIMLRTLDASDIDHSDGRRLIFIGDVHGSYDPLERLMSKISYDSKHDTLIHVGDLIAKGDKNEEVIQWMIKHKIKGVRGNHDQPVLQWRAWMEWAGGNNWESYVDDLASAGEKGAFKALVKEKKMFPKDWEWKGEHWKIARHLSASSYRYLIDLPLVLHLPSLHSFVVHAGLLPHDTLKALDDSTQPLLSADTVSANTSLVEIASSRSAEELSILRDVPQNTVPWNLINMRSVRSKGKKKGQPTKSSKKGTPWSKVWKKQMARCTGPGSWSVEDLLAEEWEEDEADVEEDRDRSLAIKRDEDNDEVDESSLKCSPVTVIYGHAAGRGLDIKPFSKGIDTGCVYGKKLTALILGDRKLKGKAVRVGDEHGILVSESCKKHGY